MLIEPFQPFDVLDFLYYNFVNKQVKMMTVLYKRLLQESHLSNHQKIKKLEYKLLLPKKQWLLSRKFQFSKSDDFKKRSIVSKNYAY